MESLPGCDSKGPYSQLILRLRQEDPNIRVNLVNIMRVHFKQKGKGDGKNFGGKVIILHVKSLISFSKMGAKKIFYDIS